MKVLVCGGRDYSNEEYLFSILDKVLEKYGYDLVIIHGSCPTGADDMAEKWVKSRKVDYMGFPAKWGKYKKAAGPIRNKHMRDTSKPDACIAFGGGDGTKGMCALMMEVGITPWVHP